MQTNLTLRTKKFAIDVWHFCNKRPNSRGFNGYVNQLIRCSSSVGANFRASQRAKSTADFINKLKIVEEEADETLYFLELISEINTDQSLVVELARLLDEGEQILKMIVSSINKARNG
jgi:four helix bundle protein